MIDAADGHIRAPDPPDPIINVVIGGVNQFYDDEGNLLPPPQQVVIGEIRDAGDNVVSFEDHTDDEVMDGEDEPIEPPPDINQLLETPIVLEGDDGDAPNSSDEEGGNDEEIPGGGEEEIPAPRIRSEGHSMSLRSRLPLPDSHRDT